MILYLQTVCYYIYKQFVIIIVTVCTIKEKLLKIIYITLLSFVFVNLLGCQKGLPATEKVVVKNKQVTVIKLKIPCPQATMPYIKDTTKLKKMLLSSGKITKEMSVKQVNKMVKNYIKKKRDAFNRCKKEG